MIAPAGPSPKIFTVNLSSPFKVDPKSKVPTKARPKAADAVCQVSCLRCASATVSVAFTA
jgi:hypothetical protein